ncbi:unnamed protein product [Prunus armeniaca]
MTSNERPRLFLRDLLFRIENSAFMESSSSLMLGEKLCAVFKPLIALVEAFIFSLVGCFDRQRPHQRLSYTYDEIVRLAASSPFTVNEVEALRELFNQLSSSILDDGLIHKEELRLALFKTPAGENLFLDRVFDVFDEKKNGVIEFEGFVHALSVFHPCAPLEDKIDCKNSTIQLQLLKVWRHFMLKDFFLLLSFGFFAVAFRLYDLRQSGYIEREEVRQMVVATLLESGIHVPDETLEAIVNKTFADADSDKDDKISKDEWKAFALQHPTLLKNMTLPHLKYLLTAFNSS